MNEKRQQLLETALTLFYRDSVQAVGINEVLKVSGVAKKTLYHHFASKDELILSTLEYRDEKFCSWFESLLEGASSNLELAERMFHGLSGWFNNQVEQLDAFRGCFFINTSAEFSDQDCRISEYCKEHKRRIRQLIACHMPDPDDDFVDSLCLLKEGAIVMAYVGQDLNAAERSLELLRERYRYNT